MDLIQQWYKKMDYAEGVELVELYEPDHPLLSMLKEGETPMNKIYLTGIIPDLKAPAPTTEEEPATATVAKPPPTIHHLYIRQKELLHGRAITRNKFHEYGLRSDVPAVQARQRINQDLIAIRKELNDVSRKIEHYESTGQLVQVPDVSDVVSPIAEADHQALLNARSNVSRWKRKVAKLYEQKADKEKIQSAELRLKKYETERDFLDEKLKGDG